MQQQRKPEVGNQCISDARSQASHVHVRLALDGLDQDHELVAAETRHHGIRAGNRLHHVVDAPRHLQQDLVAGFVAKGVVDPLEIVEIGEQQCQLPARALQCAQALVQRFAEGEPIGQACQRIAVGDAANVAVVAGHAFAHPPERAHQVSQLVLAFAGGHGQGKIAGFDLARGIAKHADRAHQDALQQRRGGQAGHPEASAQQQQPSQAAPADLVDARAQTVHRLRLGPQHPLQ